MRGVFLACLLLTGLMAKSQTTPVTKQVTQRTQSWYSINSTFRFSDRWGAVADFHTLNDGLFEDNFYFLRFGGVYWIDGKHPVIAGVGRMWKAPAEGLQTWAIENRIYQQWSTATHTGRWSILQRIRTEQRWRDQLVNDTIIGTQFSFRLRYLAGFEFSAFKNPKLPAFVISDELLVQFGPSIVFNTFDQNRFFVGIRLHVSERVNFDTGYMNIFQQRPTGYQYDMSHVFRLFIYYHLDASRTGREKRFHENTE
jgi:Protein of unknown function (DUF2490)